MYRIAASLSAAGLLFSVAAAQELEIPDPSNPDPQREFIAPDLPDARDRPQSDTSLDQLFADLKREPDAEDARRLERQIWMRWTASGSDSIDLLMGWAQRAMTERKWNAAIDVLNHVVVLAPDYAEGWNRRATVHYLNSDYSRSIADIEKVLDLEPRHFGAMAGMAAIMQKLRHQERALFMWHRVLEIYPANRTAQKAVIDLEERLSGQGT